MSNDSSKKWIPRIVKESYAFAMALVVVLPFMIAFVVVVTILRDVVLLEKMTALLGGLVAIIVGYYFGQRPLKELSKQVQDVQEEITTKKLRYHGDKEDALDIFDEYDDIKKDLAEIIKLEGELNDE